MSSVLIHQEFKSLIPPLQLEEYQLLEDSLRQEGCRDSLLCWNGVIIDGHNRYEICERYGIPYQVKPINFSSRDEATIWIIRNQLDPRNLTPFARAELALLMEPIIRKKAKENQGTRTDLCQTSDRSSIERPPLSDLEPIDTKRVISSIANISHDTLAKVISSPVIKSPKAPIKIPRHICSVGLSWGGLRHRE